MSAGEFRIRLGSPACRARDSHAPAAPSPGERCPDAGCGPLGVLEVRPGDANALPPGELAHQLLAALLAHQYVDRILVRASELVVLDPAVDLDPHSELRPGEVQASNDHSACVPDRELDTRPGQTLPEEEIAGPRRGCAPHLSGW